MMAPFGRRLREAVAALTVAVALWLGSLPAVAIEAEFLARNVPRDILALYDGRHEKRPHETRIHHFAEMPLNHLGLRVVYHDINTPLPALDQLARYQGILTWFIEPLANAEAYVDWLDKATAQGTRLVFLSELAPPDPPTSARAIAAILDRLGLELTQQYVSVTSDARIADLDRTMLGFERPVDKVLPDFLVMLAKPGKARVHLSVDAPTRIGMKRAALVVTSEAGGYASDEYTIYFEPNTDKVQWILNPFEFFRRAFGAGRVPMPDVTTVSGRRIYFSHIDGDGWNNLTELEKYRDAQMLSAEVIAREAILPYPDLPVSVGLIAGDIDQQLGGRPESAAVAKRLYALPQVEVASHTYTHPFNWSFFEKYDRVAEQALIDGAQRPGLKLADRLRSVTRALAGKEQGADPTNRYIAGSDDLPRTYLKLPFDLDKEVRRALAVSESFAPPGKKAKLYLWSGDTTPFEGALAATRAAGARNMNGGDSRLDKEYPSVFYVPPISRPMGKERQIFAGNSNENTYTNDWLGPYYGYFMLEKTLDNTEIPRRLKPFNVYYHMYTGEKESALAALKYILDLARRSDIAPIAASNYAAIADDFFGVDVRQVDASAWEYRNRGAMQTVRLDDADMLTVDFEKSRGVIGFNRHAGAIYATLDRAVEPAIVALKRKDLDGEQVLNAAGLNLVHGRWQLSNVKREDCAVEMTAEGFGKGDMLWRAPPGRGYLMAASRHGAVYDREVVRADAQGVLKLVVEADAIEPLTVRLECQE